jgi:hypothetical protein
MLCLLLLRAGGAIVLLWLAAGPAWALYSWVALIGATSLGWNGIYMAELARCGVSAAISLAAVYRSAIGHCVCNTVG